MRELIIEKIKKNMEDFPEELKVIKVWIDNTSEPIENLSNEELLWVYNWMRNILA